MLHIMKTLIFILFLYNCRNIIIPKLIKNIGFYLKFIYGIKKIELYYNYCNEIKLNVIKSKRILKKQKDPKITIISTVYNRGRYLLRFLKSLKNQKFIDIEIIIVDDFSKDNSINIIEEHKKRDNRIILLKNKKNKGTFISRNIGVFFSKGKYVVFPDPDDILLRNILKLCYNLAEKYNYEMIRFIVYIGKGKFTFEKSIKELEDRPIYQPELSNYLFYGKEELKITDCCVSNKFIRKEVFIRALNVLKILYLNMYIIYMEDSIMNYIFYKTAKSFFFLKQIGYYYIKHSISITNNLMKINLLIDEYSLLFLNIVFDYSKNTKKEKDTYNYLFTNFFNKLSFLKNLSCFNHDYFFYYNIFKTQIRSKFVTPDNKNLLKILNYNNKMKKL